MQEHDETIAKHDSSSDAGQTRKGLIHWYWLIVIAVVAFRLGMDIQHHLDYKVIDSYKEIVQDCKDLVEGLNVQESTPSHWS